MKKLIVIIVILAAAVGGGWYFYSFKTGVKQKSRSSLTARVRKDMQAKKEVFVKVGKPEMKSLSVSIKSVGTVQENRKCAIKSQVQGMIKSIRKKLNESVKKGDVLFIFDDSEAKLLYDQAVSEHTIANTNLERARYSVDEKRLELKNRIIEAKSNYDELSVRFQQSKKDYDRAEKLIVIEAITAEDYESYKAVMERTRVEYESAEKILTVLVENIENCNNIDRYIESHVSVKNALANVQLAVKEMDKARKAVERAEYDLKKYTVISPTDGIFSQKYCEEGTSVVVDTPLCDVSDIDTVFIDISIPEKHYRTIKKDMEVKIKFDAYAQADFFGRVLTVFKEIDLQTRTFTARVEIENTEQKFVPGMFARCEITEKTSDSILVLPSACILGSAAQPYVFTVKDGVAFTRKISVGSQAEGFTEVSGIDATTDVIVEGYEAVSDMMKVSVIEE